MATGEITTLPEDSGSGGFPPGNFKAPKRLYCKNGGYFLRIGSDGRVDGVREKHDPHNSDSDSDSDNFISPIEGQFSLRSQSPSVNDVERQRHRLLGRTRGSAPEVLSESVIQTLVKLQLQATSLGEVVIKGICANRYLAMNSEGRLFGARRPSDECYFLERLEPNNYNTYRSRKYPDWYVALKRNGQFKLGSQTGPGQKAILFLPMSSRS